MKLTFNPPIPLKQFCVEEAARLTKSPQRIYGLIYRGDYRLKVWRKNPRVVFVVSATKVIPEPQIGEVQLKDFLTSEAERIGCTTNAISMRVARGKYDDKLTFRRVNRRVIFVKVKNEQLQRKIGDPT
jgi:hypothetical protein